LLRGYRRAGGWENSGELLAASDDEASLFADDDDVAEFEAKIEVARPKPECKRPSPVASCFSYCFPYGKTHPLELWPSRDSQIALRPASKYLPSALAPPSTWKMGSSLTTGPPPGYGDLSTIGASYRRIAAVGGLSREVLILRHWKW